MFAELHLGVRMAEQSQRRCYTQVLALGGWLPMSCVDEECDIGWTSEFVFSHVIYACVDSWLVQIW